MSDNTVLKICKNCVNPMFLLPDMTFFKDGQGVICSDCMDVKNSFPSKEHFDKELDEFLNERERVLFAFSGGLDSVITLAYFSKECLKRGIKLEIITIFTGVKGRVAKENILNVISHFGLEKNITFIDIRDKLQTSQTVLESVGSAMPSKDLYLELYQKGILPCGKICNSVIDAEYREAMDRLDYDILITGGDTPKKNAKGKYSLFWQKKSGITILRGAYAFGLSKKANKNFIREHDIPWIDFSWGGYDTDCLVPGAFFRREVKNKPYLGISATIKRFPIILDYLSERVRFGIISREEALEKLRKIDIASDEAFSEFLNLLKRKDDK